MTVQVETFIGEIRMFGGNFAPAGWACCDGQLLSVSENQALFSLLGITYGGDGRTNFALPDLRGRIPIHFGSGPGLSTRPIGQMSGTETVTLTTTQIASHSHSFNASAKDADSQELTGRFFAKTPAGDNFYAVPTPDKQVNLLPGSIGASGGGRPHDNMMPCMCVNFIIALGGEYPSRN